LAVGNGNIAKIKQLKVKGGGGTSHKPVFEYIQKNISDCRVALFLTDGYSDLEGLDFHERFAKIFLISEGGTGDWAKNKPCKLIYSKPKADG
jgi:predicted metal-dependent peptidase